MNASTRKPWLLFACLFLLAAVPAAAQPSGLFISEYIEGTSNNKAIEIYNGTGAAINLAAGGYNIQMYFNGSATAGLTINLTGTVAAGDVYVVAHSSANPAILAQADQTNGSGWFNGDDAVVLRQGTTVIDVVGQIGFDPGTEWGTGLTSTADNTLRRKAAVCAGDANGIDAFDPARRVGRLRHGHLRGPRRARGRVHRQPSVITCGATLSVPQGESATRDVTANDPDGIVTSLDLTSVTPEPSAGTISRTAFTAASASGGIATATVTVGAGVPAGSYAVLMTASNSDTTPQTATCTLTVSVIGPKEIWEIQGSGAASPLASQRIRTDRQHRHGPRIQRHRDPTGSSSRRPTPAQTARTRPRTGSSSSPAACRQWPWATRWTLPATVAEFFNMTELTGPTFTVDSSGNPLPAAALLTQIAPGVFVPSHDQPWPANELERFEGMLVRVENGRTTGPTDRFGDIAIVADDTRAFREPGIEYPGGFGYPVIWDGNPEIFEINPAGAGLPGVTLPAGSVIHVAEGPLAYSFSDFQIWPTTFTYTAADLPRAVRARQPGELTVASQNLLRFFDSDPTNGPDESPSPRRSTRLGWPRPRCTSAPCSARPTCCRSRRSRTSACCTTWRPRSPSTTRLWPTPRTCSRATTSAGSTPVSSCAARSP